MKVVCVVDSISDIKQKIELLNFRFGGNILYVVKSKFLTLFETFGHKANAVYSNKLSNVIQLLLAKSNLDDCVICYTSVNLTNELLNNFIGKIKDGKKIVNVVPNYNPFERFENNMYNTYVKSIFKVPDTMASAKLQYIPKDVVETLIETHWGNRLFLKDEEISTELIIEDKNLSKSLKTETKFNKFYLIPIIVALLLTIGVVMCLAFFKVKFLLVIIFILLYVLDIILALIFKYKDKFDKRFLK